MSRLFVKPHPNIDMTLDLITILRYCPNLEKLYLWETTIEDPVLIYNFAKLRQIHILYYKNFPLVKIDFLSRILAAPELEHINLLLPHKHLDAYDLKDLASLISRNEILNNLPGLQHKHHP
ncbi:Hypothetical predicted protein [Cloeon dipterum]|uniref:F-box domain-containing protein n=1 Tax=Cloeon dipterum TaxID=197152 RepID=A0A8S1CNL2_9INSE|nr:Hypothetical predicted protein [Cloeon dipterum]